VLGCSLVGVWPGSVLGWVDVEVDVEGAGGRYVVELC